MKITIIDVYHDSDRGGVGILDGILGSLKRAAENVGITPDFTFVRRFHVKDPRYRTANRHVKRLYPDVPVFGAPIDRTVARLLLSILRLAAPNIFGGPVIRALRSSDLVVSKGGHFYYSRRRNPFDGFLHMYFNMYTALLAIRLRRPLLFVSHSVGPFSSSGARWLARYVFSKAEYLSVREEKSREILKEIGVIGDIELLPDCAFAMTAGSEADVREALKSTYVPSSNESYGVVTARTWIFPDHPGGRQERYDEYIRGLAELCDYMLERGYLDRLLLMVHNDGEHGDEGDGIPVRDLYDNMRNKKHALIIREDLCPRVQATLYGGAEVIIGTRLHSIIFALAAAGTPFIAINYTHKVNGIVAMLSRSEYVMPIDRIDVGDGYKLIDKLMQARDSMRHDNVARATKLRHQLDDKMVELLRHWQHDC